jgi:hypothetical protein
LFNISRLGRQFRKTPRQAVFLIEILFLFPGRFFLKHQAFDFQTLLGFMGVGFFPGADRV